MRRTFLKLIAAGTAGITLSACTSGSGSGSSPDPDGASDKTPVTITMWSFFTDKEKSIVDDVVADFQEAHPWITVKHTGGQTSDTQLQSLRGNTAPDVMLYGESLAVPALCESGQLTPLNEYMERDSISADQFVAATQSYTSWEDTIGAFPVLSDVYALYYNKDALEAAGITPPTTWDELTTAAQELTVRNSDGSIKTAGFLPLLDYAEMNAATVTPGFNLQWYDDSGKSALVSDPNWNTMLTWQKELIEFYGQDELKTFRAGLGEEFSTANPFYTGDIAMIIDGEWRVGFIEREMPDLNYGVVPIPNNDASKYGGGYIAGTVACIPSRSKHQEPAWQLIKYLATDDGALHKLAMGLKNVPSTTSALEDSELRKSEQFATLMDIAGNANSQSLPATLHGTAAKDLIDKQIGEWQEDSASDPTEFLAGLKEAVDNALEQSGP